MAELQPIIAWFVGVLTSVLIFLFITKNRKKKDAEQCCGDLYIVKDSEEGTLTYVAWETEPENYINKDRVILKVKTK